MAFYCCRHAECHSPAGVTILTTSPQAELEKAFIEGTDRSDSFAIRRRRAKGGTQPLDYWGRDRVLMPRQSDFLAERCRGLGLEVYDPDVSAITMVGGGIHCMCQPLKRD